MKQSKAHPYLRDLLDGFIEAAPNFTQAPGKFACSLSEQLKDKGKEENKRIQEEIESISEEKLRELIKQAGCEQKEDIDLIVDKVKLIPEILRVIDYRFDKVDEAHEEIKRLLQRQKPDLEFPLAPGLYNQAFHIRQIGEWETDLSLVRTFFPKGDLSQMPLVSKKSDQNRGICWGMSI